ncbi:alpha/beta fold hydrolase, partial [Microcoleus sp. B4-C1]|uniref:alpha/beta fold hydrolase n=1 Tax=Microcoleus sp. B4-C1 TaxID=2818660 RepID=UPI003B1A1D72
AGCGETRTPRPNREGRGTISPLDSTRMIPPRFARPHQFVECNPNYLELVELDNAGHCPQDECPEQVNQAILNWMSRNFAPMGESELQHC